MPTFKGRQRERQAYKREVVLCCPREEAKVAKIGIFGTSNCSARHA